jgi:hypothetical protein
LLVDRVIDCKPGGHNRRSGLIRSDWRVPRPNDILKR